MCVCVCVQARRPSSNRQQVRTFSHNSYKHDTFSFVFFRLSSFSLRWSTKERVTKQKDERRKRRGSGETPRVSFSSYWHEAQFFCLVFFFLPFVVLCMSRGNRQQSTLANKKKAVSPSVHCTYSSMNEEKKNGTLLSSKGGGKDNLPASHPYFKIKTKEVPTFRGNVKHLFSRAYCGTFSFLFFLFTYLECCFGKNTKVRHHTKR